MKKHLLSLTMLAGLGVCSANAEDFYIIKDGKLAKGIEVLKYADPSEGTVVTETTAPDGSNAVSILPQVQYNDTRFYCACKPIDLSETWNVEIEFFYEDGAINMDEHVGSKWPVINMGLADDTTGGKYGLDNCATEITFDVKFKNPADTWNTESQFIYAPVAMQSAQLLTFGWQRQILETAALGPVYIKNLKFVGGGSKPFFYENFNLGNPVYGETASNIGTYIVPFDGKSYTHDYSAVKNITDRFVSNLPLYIGMAEDANEDYQFEANCKRLFEDFGTDGSDFYDDEVRQGLNIIKPKPGSKPGRGKDGRFGRNYFLIPMAGLEYISTFNIEYICKWDASRALEENFGEETSEDSLVVPVYYAFVDTPEEANTCEMNPAWNKGDLLNGQYTQYSYQADATVGAGKKYMALIFDEPKFFSYIVDNVRVSALNRGERHSLGSAVAEAHPVGVVSYNMIQNCCGPNPLDPVVDTCANYGFAEHISNVKFVSVYPNPVDDVFEIDADGVKYVYVYNELGELVLESSSKKVNAARVPSGVYTVKAVTNEGNVYARLIKK